MMSLNEDTYVHTYIGIFTYNFINGLPDLAKIATVQLQFIDVITLLGSN